VGSKVIVLGSTGFIGAALLKPLQQYSHLPVEGYGSSTLNLISPDCVDRLCEVVDEETVLVVTARSRRTEDPLEAFSEEVAIATHVARGISQRRVKKCLYFSTLSVYGDAATDLSITEETRIAPTSLYGAAKFAGECVLKQVAEKADIPLIILRPCKVYGPGDASRAYGPVGFIGSILREGKVRLFGDGTELRDHLFIRDLVRITIQLAFSDRRGTYNLATGQSYSFLEIVALLRKVVPRKFQVVHMDRSKPKVDQRIHPARLLEALPAFRFTELEQGLAETYRCFSTELSKEYLKNG